MGYVTRVCVWGGGYIIYMHTNIYSSYACDDRFIVWVEPHI